MEFATFNSDYCFILSLLISVFTLSVVYFFNPYLRKKFGSLPINRGAFWYKWRSQPTSEALEFSPFTGIIFPHKIVIRAKSAWACFIVHWIFSTVMIYMLQSKYSSYETKNCPYSEQSCGWTSQVDVLHIVFLVGTFFFFLLHLIQTHLFYDGLALDVPEASSQTCVLLSHVLVLLMQQSERGLFLGYTMNSDLNLILTNIVRRSHGYVVSSAFLFDFWYHPMESGLNHSPGFFMLLSTLIHGCLTFTVTHRNVYIRIIIEMLVLPHALLVELTHTHRDLWKMFFSGLMFVYLTIHINALETITLQSKVALFISHAVLVAYLYYPLPKPRWTEVLRIPCLYAIILAIYYIILVIFYYITNWFGMWPDKLRTDGIPGGFYAGIILSIITLVIATGVLTAVGAEINEYILRVLVRRAGPPSAKVQTIFDNINETNSLTEDRNLSHNLKRISYDELSKHNTDSDCWVAIYGTVYDVTEFVKFHPGGKAILVNASGRDASKDFANIHRGQGHPKIILNRMKVFAIGKLSSKE